MKKNIGIFLVAAILISLSFTSISLAQNVVPKENSVIEIQKEKNELDIESKSLERLEADLGKRASALGAEKEAIKQEHIALRAGFTEYAQRKMGYDQKCAGQTFHRDNPGEMQIEGECRSEAAWLKNAYASLSGRKETNDKREVEFKKGVDQLKLDSDAFQAKKEAWQAKMYAWTVKKNTIITPTTEEKVRQAIPAAIDAIKDQRIKNWINKNVKFEFLDVSQQESHLMPPLQRDMPSPWAGDSKLIFTRSFLAESVPMRENLIAFEAGKVFYANMKNKPVGEGKTLSQWFAGFASEHADAIQNMKDAKNQTGGIPTEGLGTVMIADPAWEGTSAFGYIFRAQALQLEKPKDKKAQEEWDKTVSEFQKNINPLLQSR